MVVTIELGEKKVRIVGRWKKTESNVFESWLQSLGMIGDGVKSFWRNIGARTKEIYLGTPSPMGDPSWLIVTTDGEVYQIIALIPRKIYPSSFGSDEVV